MTSDLLTLHFGAPVAVAPTASVSSASVAPCGTRSSIAVDAPRARFDTVRAMAEADAPQLARAYASAYPSDVGAATIDEATQEIADSFAGEYGELRRDLCFVAGAPVAGGILVTTRSIWDDIDGPFIIDLFVDPSRQGHGYGRALVHAVIEACRDAGETRLSLRVGEGTSPAAYAIYEQVGFVVAEV